MSCQFTPLMLCVVMVVGCGGSSSPTDTGHPSGNTSYTVRILADNATADPAIGKRCQIIRLAAATTPALSGASFNWSSENESIATVSSVGEVVLARTGETRVRAVLRQDSTAAATQRIRVEAADQPLFGELTVAVNGVSTRVNNATIASGEYQRLFTYGVAPAYASGVIETFIDGVISYRDNVEPAAVDGCATVVLGFKWRAGQAPWQPGPHSFSARLKDANGQEVYEIVANFTIK